MFAVSCRATERGIRQRAQLRLVKPAAPEPIQSIADIRRERMEREAARKRAEMAEWIRRNDERRAKEAMARAQREAIAAYRVIDVRKVHTPARSIIERVAAFHGVTAEEIIGARRSRQIVEARFDAIKAVADARPDLSLVQIGRVFGKDHTSIIHALRVRNGRTALESKEGRG